ncbi:POK18 protein, partial [Calyptomena viridis]|nr:POK18 protein [Calyptomena viridis]
QEKLLKIWELVDEQLTADHIVPSNSSWNTPIFTIPKKSGKWRLLHDLRALNAVMEDMGSLQPCLPSPVMLPENWDLLIIDLKDCFFTIPLHPEDAERFAFSVPSINKAESAKRYHWVVLPQGMKNSPTMCQTFVAWALEPVRKQFPEVIIYHYMDDILIAGKNLNISNILQQLTQNLENRGLKIAPEKIQRQAPWNRTQCWQNLHWIITESMIKPQKLEIRTEIKTLNDVQKLVRDIQWVRSLCGITNDDLEPLIKLLGTSTQANDKRYLGKNQEKALSIISQKIANCHADRVNENYSIMLMLINSEREQGQRKHPCALIMQGISNRKNPLRILEWIFLSIRPNKTVSTRAELFALLIMKGRNRTQELAGIDPSTIFIPMVQVYLEWMLRWSEDIQTALIGFSGQICNHYPAQKLLPMLQNQIFEQKPWKSETPVQGVTVLTDAGKKSRKVVSTWKNDHEEWQEHIIQGHEKDSLQTLELKAVIWALQHWDQEPINIVSDSLYVVGVVARIERAMLREVSNKTLAELLQQLWVTVNSRRAEYFITHIRSHLMTRGL